MPSDHGRTNPYPGMPGRAVKRLRLLDQADEVLVETNRWLTRYPFDVRVMEARDRLRAVHPVDPEDTDDGNGV